MTMLLRQLTTLAATLLLCSCTAEREVRFDASHTTELVTRLAQRSDGRRVTLVKAAVDGVDLGWCLLDSGASALLVSEEKMAELGLPSRGEGALPAPCTTSYTAHEARELTVGPLRLPQPVLYSMSLRGLSAELDVELGGILGQPLFAAATVRIAPGPEGEPDRISLHDPKAYVLPEGAWSDLEFRGHYPVVLATHEGHPSEFVISTGDPLGVQFFAWATKRKRLLRHREVEEMSVATLCGETKQQEGVLANFILAGQRFNEVPARFMEPGSISEIRDARVSGIIGCGLLKHFTLVLDYQGRRAAFVPLL